MSRQEQRTLEAKRLIPITKLDEKNEEQKLSNFNKFLRDYNAIHQKISDLFSNIDIKTASTPAISTNMYLVYQIIWTLKYLVEFAVIENKNEWLKYSLPLLREGIKRIEKNITAADPMGQTKLQEGVDKLFIEIETLLKKEKQDIALRWIENIVSLGGSAIRDISEISRRTTARQRLEEKTGYISDHNTAALLRAESYQQYLQETSFNKATLPLIIAHNRSMQLQYIKERLNKDPTNKSLLAEQKELLTEQKKDDETESQVRKIMGDEDYNKMIKQREMKLEKIRIRNELSTLVQEYLQASKSLFLEDSEPSNKILLAIDLLQKSLSKTLANNEIFLPYQELKKQLKSIKNEIQHLKSLSEKLPFGKQSEFKLPVGAIPTPLVRVAMNEKLAKSDSKISTIKAIREEFFALRKALENSDLLSKNQIIAESQRNYEAYIAKSARYLLSDSTKKYSESLFEIDVKYDTNFTAEEVNKKFRELSLIFHPDKLSSEEAKSVAQLIFPFIEQTKQELLYRLYDIQVGGPMASILPVILSRIEEAKKLLELSVSDNKASPPLSKNNNNVYSKSRVNERGSSILNSASTLKI